MILIFQIYDAVGWEKNKIKIYLLPDIFIPFSSSFPFIDLQPLYCKFLQYVY